MLQQQWPRIFRQIRVGYNFCQNQYYSSEINSVPLTTDRYPNVKRGDFAILQESDVKFFESIIGANRILTQEDELNGIKFKNLQRSCKDYVVLKCWWFLVPQYLQLKY